MGQNELLLIAMFVVPVLVLLLLRANAVLVFLSLCLGYVVGQLLGPDLQAFADLFVANMTPSSMRLGLIAASGLLTALFFTRSVKGSRALLNIVPALAVGCLVLALAVPLLSPDLSRAMMGLPLWQQFARTQSLLIGGGAIICLLMLWLQRSIPNKPASGKKRSSQD